MCCIEKSVLLDPAVQCVTKTPEGVAAVIPTDYQFSRWYRSQREVIVNSFTVAPEDKTSKHEIPLKLTRVSDKGSPIDLSSPRAGEEVAALTTTGNVRKR